MPTFEFRISNSTERSAAFYLEPWGGKYPIPSRRALRVVIDAPSPPQLEWELASDTHTLIVHHPPGAVATVYDGERIVLAE